MRLLLGTNVLIAAFIARGQCHELLEYAVREHSLFTSRFILDEFLDKLLTKFRYPEDMAGQALELLRTRMLIVEPVPLPVPVCRDPNDDHVLAAAVAAQADVVISGDKNLLTLSHYQEIPILAPADFWRFEAERR